jgi:hypothetical protein
VLAYLSWHRPAATIEQSVYEQALEQFHRSLAHRPPSGFRGSVAFRAAELPWLEAETTVGAGATVASGYEDWYLLDDWTAVGILEEAAVSHGHVSVHDNLASRSESSTSAVYRLIEGCTELAGTRLAVWVKSARGHERPSLETMLGDGMNPATGSLWRRCLGLGPAPEFCLLVAASSPEGETPAGVADDRLPKGWTAGTFEREALWGE